MAGMNSMAGLLAAAPEINSFSHMLDRIKAQYPALSPYNFNVVDSRTRPSKWGGSVEFYPPEESENPTPGRPTIEVFSTAPRGAALQQAIFGDMLHHLPAVDPQWERMRSQFSAAMRPEQLQIDERAYREAVAGGERRSFPDWMKQSRLDAYIRGYLAPDAQDEWRQSGAYTTDQLNILEGMRNHLRGAR